MYAYSVLLPPLLLLLMLLLLLCVAILLLLLVQQQCCCLLLLFVMVCPFAAFLRKVLQQCSLEPSFSYVPWNGPEVAFLRTVL